MFFTGFVEYKLKKRKYRILAHCLLYENDSCPTENSRCRCYSIYLFCSIIVKPVVFHSIYLSGKKKKLVFHKAE
jgi:hypothetical protein